MGKIDNLRNWCSNSLGAAYSYLNVFLQANRQNQTALIVFKEARVFHLRISILLVIVAGVHFS
jgi:hypothetical protein